MLREAVRTNPLDPPVIRAQLKERVETGAIVEGSGKESRRGTRKNEKNVKKAEESSNLPRSSFQAVFFFQKAARKLSFCCLRITRYSHLEEAYSIPYRYSTFHGEYYTRSQSHAATESLHTIYPSGSALRMISNDHERVKHLTNDDGRSATRPQEE